MKQITKTRVLSIQDDISAAGSFFLKRHEPMYVVDSENTLFGTVTVGDFYRKAHEAQYVSQLMNRHFIKVEQNLLADNSDNNTEETADKLFNLFPKINEIPVVESGKLVSVQKRRISRSGFIDGEVIRFGNIAFSFSEAEKGKKLMVLGKNDMSKLIVQSVNSSCKAHFIDDVSELVYDDPATFFVMVIEPRRTFAQIQRDFASCNFIEGINYNMVCYKNPFDTYAKSIDAHLMFNRMLDLPGFAAYGNVNNAMLRIVTLGASTTDPCLNDFASWPEHLRRILKDKGFEPAVYNGGYAAYNSSLELTKLIRDVLPMKPDIVISYGGIGDFIYAFRDKNTGLCKHPYLHHFHADYFNNMTDGEVIFGLPNDKTIGDHWIENMRMMNCLCNEFGILHLAVLQANPYADGLPPEHLHKSWQLLQSHAYADVSWGNEVVINASDEKYLMQIYDSVESAIENIAYIKSYRRIFDGIDDVYYDGAHVQERGNEVIAAHMYESLKSMGYI